MRKSGLISLALGTALGAATLSLTGTAIRFGIPLANRGSAMAGEVSDLFSQGLRDRTKWENWFSSLTGDKRAGAEYWAGQRSLSHPGDCVGTPDFAKGCNEAKARLSGPDVLRKLHPDYKAGWNAYVATSSPPPVGSSPAAPGINASPAEPATKPSSAPTAPGAAPQAPALRGQGTTEPPAVTSAGTARVAPGAAHADSVTDFTGTTRTFASTANCGYGAWVTGADDPQYKSCTKPIAPVAMAGGALLDRMATIASRSLATRCAVQKRAMPDAPDCLAVADQIYSHDRLASYLVALDQHQRNCLFISVGRNTFKSTAELDDVVNSCHIPEAFHEAGAGYAQALSLLNY